MRRGPPPPDVLDPHARVTGGSDPAKPDAAHPSFRPAVSAPAALSPGGASVPTLWPPVSGFYGGRRFRRQLFAERGQPPEAAPSQPHPEHVVIGCTSRGHQGLRIRWRRRRCEGSQAEPNGRCRLTQAAPATVPGADNTGAASTDVVWMRRSTSRSARHPASLRGPAPTAGLQPPPAARPHLRRLAGRGAEDSRDWRRLAKPARARAPAEPTAEHEWAAQPAACRSRTSTRVSIGGLGVVISGPRSPTAPSRSGHRLRPTADDDDLPHRGDARAHDSLRAPMWRFCADDSARRAGFQPGPAMADPPDDQPLPDSGPLHQSLKQPRGRNRGSATRCPRFAPLESGEVGRGVGRPRAGRP